MYTSSYDRDQKEVRAKETSSLQLLAPLLLTVGNGADLMIRGNVVLNIYFFFVQIHIGLLLI
jgi:hypothetical protein